MDGTSQQVIYGRRVVQRLDRDLPKGAVLYVAPNDIGHIVGSALGERGIIRYDRLDLDADRLETDVGMLPHFDAVVGLGGGVAMDTAKYCAWKRKRPLWLVPSVMSVDACFSVPVAVRRDHRVVYEGESRPEAIYVDFELIQGAPARLNRAGLGDLLSCHTALYDWRLAARERADGVRWSDAVAGATRRLLDETKARIDEIRDVTEAGIRFVMEGYRWVADAAPTVGGCFYEEGSEHFFAYTVEYLTGRSFLHGQLVCLGVYLMSLLQGNDAGRALAMIRGAGVDISPQSVGLTMDEIYQALIEAPRHTAREQYQYSIINERPPTPEVSQKILADYQATFRATDAGTPRG